MTGLGERTARTLLSNLIETGLVTSTGHVAPVRFAFPLDTLQFLRPELYAEAATRDDELTVHRAALCTHKARQPECYHMKPSNT